MKKAQMNNVVPKTVRSSNKTIRSSKKDDEVDEEVVVAAWILVEMQQSKIDAQTALKLHTQMQNHMKKRQAPVPPPPAPAKKPNRHHINNHDHDDQGNNNALLLPQETNHRNLALQVKASIPASIPPVPTRPVPESLLSGIMGVCSKPLYKQLCESDLKPHLSKVTLVKKQVKQYLLPLLEERDGVVASKDGIRVITYDWEGNGFSMQFKSWTEEKMFVLTGGWKDLCTRHRDTLMVADNVAVLWMFRHKITGQICFAVNVVKMSSFRSSDELDQFVQNFVDRYHGGIKTTACIYRER